MDDYKPLPKSLTGDETPKKVGDFKVRKISSYIVSMLVIIIVLLSFWLGMSMYPKSIPYEENLNKSYNKGLLEGAMVGAETIMNYTRDTGLGLISVNGELIRVNCTGAVV